MRIVIVPADGRGAAHKLAEAEVHFAEGPLAGLKLVGIALWQGNGEDGTPSVTFPSRAYQAARGLTYHNFLRPVDGGRAAFGRLQAAVLEAYARTPIAAVLEARASTPRRTR